MISRLTAILCLAALLLQLAACDLFAAALPESPDPAQTNISDPPEPSGGLSPKPPKPAERFTVSFPADEVFPDEPSRLAAAHIDPILQKAVMLLNTIEEEDPFTVESCDYALRPTARDGLTDPVALEIYDIMVEKASAFADHQFDEHAYDTDNFFGSYANAYEALMVDHKEILMYSDLLNDYALGYYMPGDWLDSLCDDREAVRSEVERYHRTIDRILDKMPEELTNYQKCMYFAFVIAVAAEYDRDLSSLPHPCQIHDTLIEGEAICQGYAQTFARLCRSAGISCYYCTGTVHTGDHAWNLVDTTEGPRLVDITWYDTPEIDDHYRDGQHRNLFRDPAEAAAEDGYIAAQTW